MSDRYTRKDAERAFYELARVLGADTGPTGEVKDGQYRQRAGTWTLDHNAVDGGYVVHEMRERGVACPLGDRRRSAREFCEFVSGAFIVLDEYARRVRDGRLLPIAIPPATRKED